MSCRAALLFSIFGSLMLCSCASVPPGRGAVVITSSGEAKTLTEGSSWVSPLSQVEVLDLRQQERGKLFVALTADGLPIQASDAVVTFRIVSSETVEFVQKTGPEYEKILIDPIVQSTVRWVLAGYRWNQMDTPHLIEAQQRVTAIAAEKLRPYHVILDSVELKRIIPLLPLLNDEISQTEIWKQKVLQQKSELQIARESAEVTRSDANGIRDSNRALAPTLTRRVLEDSTLKAWGALFASPSADVNIENENSSSFIEVSP